MSIFEMCPVCGKLAPVIPEYSTAFSRVFQCGEGHVFDKTSGHAPERPWEEINGLEHWFLGGVVRSHS